ncbi:signal peptidase II [Bathymodiolus septemdierum thioautotrophic gill symbiont]|uniref:Lipoprotein signal peptidase n=1 Tax=endosymbiont of Bathymodiolus septemdierum str. Myojin knoll TaxID=1303921 RepID=A0A0P0UR06_9GAMM|nr:signal peptidase II [Bathymodiolus septemdierum thioautotrophic gill symbiont]BAS67524.1 signal peptidase II [endosymbiont of Bathymodiolus septemdierum str. Myojin knoll]
MTLSKYYGIAITLILLDQLSKIFVANTMEFQSSIIVTEFFSWHHVRNYGAAFSFLADQGGWQRYFFAGLSFIASIALIVWMKKTSSTKKFELLALSLILAGAVGNLIDRVVYGFVIDFIDLHYQDFYWPVFNVADITISVGVALLLLSEFKK